MSRQFAVTKCFGMTVPPPPEVYKVSTHRVACDGSGAVSPALGHPRIYLRIDPALGWVECGYCDRRFILEGGPADLESE